jgi:DNA-binding winged helix-turn-helix (wHTH) protein/tetratricopeptide (TPR) repeat protein
MPERYRFEFGPFRLDPDRRVLLRDGDLVRLTPKVFDLLLFFAQNSGRLIRKDELMDAVWPDRPVEESNLAVCVSALRKALGERPHLRRYLATIPGSGYRFTEDVEWRAVAGRSSSSSGTVSPGTPQADVAAPSLVVLPFRVIGSEPAHPDLGVAISSAIAARLAKAGRVLLKPAALGTISVPIEDPDAVRQLGRRLGAKVVVDGTVMQWADRVRVTVELIRLRDSVVLWLDRFDEPFTDPFTVEDAIADRVGGALIPRLTGGRDRQAARVGTDNADAYHSYLKGHYFWERRVEASLRQAIGYFEDAVVRDPAYASAHVGLADCYFLLSYYSAVPPDRGYTKVREAAARALAIDPALGVAHATIGCVHLFYDWNAEQARAEFERGMALSPDQANVHHWYSEYLRVTGQFDAAVAAMERARDLDPLSLMLSTSLALVLFYARRFDAAIAHVQKTIEMDPHFGVAHWVLGLAREQQGDHAAAIRAFKRALSLSGSNALMLASLGHAYGRSRARPEARRVLTDLRRLSARRYVSPYALALVETGLGRTEQAFGYLQKALAERCGWLAYLGVTPLLDPLRGDPRLEQMTRVVGLVR